MDTMFSPLSIFYNFLIRVALVSVIFTLSSAATAQIDGQSLEGLPWLNNSIQKKQVRIIDKKKHNTSKNTSSSPKIAEVRLTCITRPVQPMCHFSPVPLENALMSLLSDLQQRVEIRAIFTEHEKNGSNALTPEVLRSTALKRAITLRDYFISLGTVPDQITMTLQGATENADRVEIYLLEPHLPQEDENTEDGPDISNEATVQE
ncbi:MAG: hypothetical protein H6908_04775 [Hyphomicrobiales bacterium]|nr:hypothetical protein [Hyphomicrobiales bacterium]